ncbi:hypothetical protein AXF42_Ash014305 [Apostasia shenzhenica]|uniref:Uncharacterized protein n=1 Tax=Apostasia shenzhenica TaxID=1088818 RepID=A0A2I0B0S4_9ASPA|nr:hypothetical protein AXF42_Ash014305 [Apostasia shenzhenica]
MGLTFSSSGGESKAMLDESFEALRGSVSFGEDQVSPDIHSRSTDAGEAETSSLVKALGSGKLTIEGSVSFKRKEAVDSFHMETKISIRSSTLDDAECGGKPSVSKRTRLNKETLEIPLDELDSPKHEAALKLQKVYKSFRTRRQLADCAVLVEQRWWKLLDFALLKRSSVSFFDIEKPESAISKWSRARTRAAKVGKGLSKNAKARKLALQHWLEAIDPRHRYGHNLQFYYHNWLRCESGQPFFYWLDVGDGKEVCLEACSRSKLQQQCIKYLGPKEREDYEVIVEDGMLIYKKSWELLDTTGGPKGSKWIFVLSTSNNLYVGLKRKGLFQHSSFLAGGATSAAGRLVVENGILQAVWPHSGHYRPTEENFEEFMSFLEEHCVDLTNVKKAPDEDDEEWGRMIRSGNSELDLAYPAFSEPQMDSERSNFCAELTSEDATTKDASSSRERDQVELEKFYSFTERTTASEEEDESGADDITESDQEEYETPKLFEDESAETLSPSKQQFMCCKPNLFKEEDYKDKETMPEEFIIQRINSKKGKNSYQMGRQLSVKWSTGAGARIGFVRNYPTELQFMALEQVNLSPRGEGFSRPFSPKMQETCTIKEVTV